MSNDTRTTEEIMLQIKKKVLEWLEVTGAIDARCSWYYELLSFFDDEVLTALNTERSLRIKAEAEVTKLRTIISKLLHKIKVEAGLTVYGEYEQLVKDALSQFEEVEFQKNEIKQLKSIIEGMRK